MLKKMLRLVQGEHEEGHVRERRTRTAVSSLDFRRLGFDVWLSHSHLKLKWPYGSYGTYPILRRTHNALSRLRAVFLTLQDRYQQPEPQSIMLVLYELKSRGTHMAFLVEVALRQRMFACGVGMLAVRIVNAPERFLRSKMQKRIDVDVRFRY